MGGTWETNGASYHLQVNFRLACPMGQEPLAKQKAGLHGGDKARGRVQRAGEGNGGCDGDVSVGTGPGAGDGADNAGRRNAPPCSFFKGRGEEVESSLEDSQLQVVCFCYKQMPVIRPQLNTTSDLTALMHLVR